MLLCVVFLAVFVLLSRGGAPAASGLILGIPLFANDAHVTGDFAERLNEYMQPDDILFVRGRPETTGLLRKVRKGKVAVIRQSLPDLRRDLEFLLSKGIKVDYICYNPEAWRSSHTPDEERDDPVRAAMEARRLADEHGLGLIIITDTVKTLPEHGAGMSREADIFGVQLQRWQRLGVAEFRERASESISHIRRGNRGVPVIAQLSTNPPVGASGTGRKQYGPSGPGEISSKIRSVRPLVDGVGFLLFSGDNGFQRFFEVLGHLRPTNRQ